MNFYVICRIEKSQILSLNKYADGIEEKSRHFSSDFEIVNVFKRINKIEIMYICDKWSRLTPSKHSMPMRLRVISKMRVCAPQMKYIVNLLDKISHTHSYCMVWYVVGLCNGIGWFGISACVCAFYVQHLCGSSLNIPVFSLFASDGRRIGNQRKKEIKTVVLSSKFDHYPKFSVHIRTSTSKAYLTGN